MADAEAVRLEGNALVKSKDYVGAIKLYKKGMGLLPEKDVARVNFHKNLSLCYIKLENFKDAVIQATAALDLSGGDVKALYRRSQAYEGDKQPEKAFEDVVKCTKLEPSNATFTKAAHRLMKLVSAKRNVKTSTAGIGTDILTTATTADTPAKRKRACNNLAAYSQDEPGCWHLFKNDAIRKLMPLLELEGEDDTVHAILHTFSRIGSTSWQRALGVLGVITSGEQQQKLIKLIQSKVDKTARAAVMILSKMLEAVSEEGVDDVMAKQGMNTILQFLIALIPNGQIVAAARDATISAIVVNAKKSDIAKRFIDLGGVRGLLVAASCSLSPLAKPDDATTTPTVGISMSKEARMQISVALSHIFAATCTTGGGKKKLMDMIKPDMQKIKREPYVPFAKDCIQAISWQQDPVSNIPACQTLAAVIQGVPEMGNVILDTEGVMPRLIKMARSESLEAKCAAAEALSHAATSKERSKELMGSGFAVLKELYAKGLPDAIRVRALSGLCKLGSQGGGFANKKTMADGAVVNLAKKIRPFLVSESKDLDSAKWASEGLAYLTLDADVKEMVVGDKKILKKIKELCIDGDPTVQYGLANLLVNVSNTFDLPEENEEKEQLKKIGKFAGEYIPEPHKLDAKEFIKRRIQILVQNKIPEAMVALAVSESDQAREQVARVFLGMCEEKENRGQIVAEGGGRALVSLANKNTEKGKVKAAQALAKIAITTNPSLAFPGQRAAETVRPLLMLCKQPHGLLQFEACMALTNLASVSEDLRMRMVREKGIKVLEDLMYEEDWRIRRVAVETLCNLMYCEKVYEMYSSKEGKCWDRLKLWILLAGCAADDFECARAAAGGIALLSTSPDVCVRITEEKQGLLVMKENAASGNVDLQMRALHTLKNMVLSGKEVAELVVDDQGLELLSALHLTLENPQLKVYVDDVMEALVEHGIIKSVNNAHKKGYDAAAALASFKRPVEEEESEEEDVDALPDDDHSARELSAEEEHGQPIDLAWPGAREIMEQEGTLKPGEEMDPATAALLGQRHDGVNPMADADSVPAPIFRDSKGYIGRDRDPDFQDQSGAGGDTDEYIEVGGAEDPKIKEVEDDGPAAAAAAAPTPAFNEAVLKAVEAGVAEGKDFVKAKTHVGSHEGYAFHSGDDGVGYYKDVKPVVDSAAAPEPTPVDPTIPKGMMALDLD